MNSKHYRVTVEASQTFSPGNVELLIYLLKKFHSEKFETTLYLGHETTIKHVNDLKIPSLKVLKSSVLQSLLRSLRKRSNVLFFCSYPPLGKHNNSFVYYHTQFFTNPYKYLKDDLSVKIKFIRIFAHWLIKIFHKKVDVFYCQTAEVKRALLVNFQNINVKCVPFFNDTDLYEEKNHKNNTMYDFFYPGTADAHKNYFNLFDAVEILGKQKKISLVVTVAKDKLGFIERIDQVNNALGYKAILNIGRVSKREVLEFYTKSKAMVFPSLEESLGLPLIEAAILKLPIIGSDLPYIYNVVENPIVFDPNNPKDIAEKMQNFLEGRYENVLQTNKINNQVEDIIIYFKK
jgi:glycosyltransferase involved in cell wall biosynthesis